METSFHPRDAVSRFASEPIIDFSKLLLGKSEFFYISIISFTFLQLTFLVANSERHSDIFVTGKRYSVSQRGKQALRLFSWSTQLSIKF